MDFLRHSLIVAGKDLSVEWRTRERSLSIFTFSLLVAVVFRFSLDITFQTDSIGGAMIWVTILFAGMLGLGRSFSGEKEQDALAGVLLTPIDRGSLYLGKFLANLTLLLVNVVFTFLIYALFFEISPDGSAGALLVVTLLACIGFMALGTLFSAMAANTRLGDNFLPVLLIPFLIPVIIFGVAATQRLLIGRPVSDVMSSIRMLAAFDLIFLFVCTMIFGSVVEE